MTKVKFFYDESPTVLELEINNFLINKNFKFIDLKFSSVLSGAAYGEEISFSAILIYEEV